MNNFEYTLFDNFLECFIKGEHKSFVQKDPTVTDVLIKESIDNLYAIFVEAIQKGEKNKDKDKSFAEVVEKVKPEDMDVLNHAIWLWGYPNNRKPQWECKKNDEKDKYKPMYSGYVAGAGSGYVQYKVKGIRFILYILSQIFDKENVDSAKDEIIIICKKDTYDDQRKENLPDGVKNLLLHLCNKDYYEPIAATADKKKIVKAFCEDTQNTDLDNVIKLIREKNEIVQKVLKGTSLSFYDNSLPLLWKGESNGDSLSRIQLLEYKKSMVLYGPPGTGKTYMAMELAKELLLRESLRNKKKDMIESILKVKTLKDLDFVYYLQLHINYNYEDFIAGQSIENGNVKTQKGFIFDIIEKAKENSTMPYIVILDEMNRVDVSRVFGELFTAIEKREQDVYLTLPDTEDASSRLVLNIPENVYFIGTMNEIDFSLEQIDFALRRRFIWELIDYNEDALEKILEDRIEGDTIDISDFLNSCTEVNKYIANKLGKEYHIGHAFFAEIGNIYKKLKKNKVSGNIWNQAKKVLWQISLQPTIEAYCGSMDKDEKRKFVDDCKSRYEK